MRHFLIIAFFLLATILGFSQDTLLFTVDSLGFRQGFYSHPSAFNLIKNEQIVRSAEVRESGYDIDGRKEGIWSCIDDKSRLIGQRCYIHDTLISETHYLRGRIISFVRYKTEQKFTEDEDIVNYRYKYVEIITFNWRGRIKKRSYLNAKGETVVVEY